MNTIEILYITFIILSISACVPQLRHVVNQKSSEEFEIRSWGVWVAAQVMTLVYVISLEAYLMALVNLAWVAFYALMLGLILYYRRFPGGRERERVPVTVSAKNS